MQPFTPLRQILRDAAHDVLRKVSGMPPSKDSDIILVPPWEITVECNHIETWPKIPPLDQLPELKEWLIRAGAMLPDLDGLPDVERAAVLAATRQPVTVKKLAEKAGYRFNSYWEEAVREVVRKGYLRKVPEGVRRN